MRGARLHRVRHQPVVDDVELGDVLGRFERRLGRLRIAEVPLIDGVVRRHVVDLRCARSLRRGRIGHRRQHRVVDLDLFGCVARLRQRLRDHDRDRIADMAALPWASAGCGAIFIGEPSLEWIIQPQMRLPILSAASSAPVSTATTPGIGRRLGVDRS